MYMYCDRTRPCAQCTLTLFWASQPRRPQQTAEVTVTATKHTKTDARDSRNVGGGGNCFAKSGYNTHKRRQVKYIFDVVLCKNIHFSRLSSAHKPRSTTTTTARLSGTCPPGFNGGNARARSPGVWRSRGHPVSFHCARACVGRSCLLSVCAFCACRCLAGK